MKQLKLLLIIAAVLTGASFGFSCRITNVGGKKEIPVRPIVDLSGFDKIKAGPAVKLEIAAGREFDVTIDDDLRPDVKTEVQGGTLIISTSRRISAENPALVRISLPELKSLDLWGSAEAEAAGITAESLTIRAGGRSKIRINGQARSLVITATGESEINAEHLRAENAKIEASGASSVTVSAANELEATAFGASTVLYTGEPAKIRQTTRGTAAVTKK